MKCSKRSVWRSFAPRGEPRGRMPMRSVSSGPFAPSVSIGYSLVSERHFESVLKTYVRHDTLHENKRPSRSSSPTSFRGRRQ